MTIQDLNKRLQYRFGNAWQEIIPVDCTATGWRSLQVLCANLQSRSTRVMVAARSNLDETLWCLVETIFDFFGVKSTVIDGGVGTDWGGAYELLQGEIAEIRKHLRDLCQRPITDSLYFDSNFIGSLAAYAAERE